MIFKSQFIASAKPRTSALFGFFALRSSINLASRPSSGCNAAAGDVDACEAVEISKVDPVLNFSMNLFITVSFTAFNTFQELGRCKVKSDEYSRIFSPLSLYNLTNVA